MSRIIFVFGSNTEGRHGAGAAKEAVKNWGAEYGNPSGLQGQSWAIITKDLARGKRSIPLPLIKVQVDHLILCARLLYSNITFLVSPIGCGLGGYFPTEIAPFFKDCPSNVQLPEEFKEVLKSLENGNQSR